jgi:hypothetical protein
MSLSRLGLVYSALLDVADELIAEFPGAPPTLVYDSLGAARRMADQALPDLAAFKWTIAREARASLSRIPSASRTAS